MKKSGNNNPDTSGKKGDVIEGELIDKESIPAEPNEKSQGSEEDNSAQAAQKADKPANSCRLARQTGSAVGTNCHCRGGLSLLDADAGR